MSDAIEAAAKALTKERQQQLLKVKELEEGDTDMLSFLLRGIRYLYTLLSDVICLLTEDLFHVVLPALLSFSLSLLRLLLLNFPHFLRRVATQTHDCTAGMWHELLMLRLIIDGGLSCVRVWQLRTMCFFVLCKRHRFNRVPGVHRVGGNGGGGRRKQCYGHGRCPSLLRRMLLGGQGM